MNSGSYRKSLLVTGALLFLLGLFQGGFVQSFLNPRIALSAHLTAVQSGMAIMIAGMIWPAVSLSSQFDGVARTGIVAGMYGLWVGLTLSALTGASAALPIAGAGFQAAPLIEQGVSALILGSSFVMTLGWLLLVIGLVRAGRA